MGKKGETKKPLLDNVESEEGEEEEEVTDDAEVPALDEPAGSNETLEKIKKEVGVCRHQVPLQGGRLECFL